MSLNDKRPLRSRRGHNLQSWEELLECAARVGVAYARNALSGARNHVAWKLKCCDIRNFGTDLTEGLLLFGEQYEISLTQIRGVRRAIALRNVVDHEDARTAPAAVTAAVLAMREFCETEWGKRSPSAEKNEAAEHAALQEADRVFGRLWQEAIAQKPDQPRLGFKQYDDSAFTPYCRVLVEHARTFEHWLKIRDIARSSGECEVWRIALYGMARTALSDFQWSQLNDGVETASAGRLVFPWIVYSRILQVLIHLEPDRAARLNINEPTFGSRNLIPVVESVRRLPASRVVGVLKDLWLLVSSPQGRYRLQLEEVCQLTISCSWHAASTVESEDYPFSEKDDIERVWDRLLKEAGPLDDAISFGAARWVRNLLAPFAD